MSREEELARIKAEMRSLWGCPLENRTPEVFLKMYNLSKTYQRLREGDET